MAPNNSSPNRLYTRFILIVKVIQYLGYFIVVFFSFSFLFLTGGLVRAGIPPLALIGIILQATIGCAIVYIFTQGLIAILDLLSRIEKNTRPL